MEDVSLLKSIIYSSVYSRKINGRGWSLRKGATEAEKRHYYKRMFSNNLKKDVIFKHDKYL